MSSHICTTDSLVSGGDIIGCYCVVCDSKQLHTIGVGGSKCHKCGVYMFDFDDFSDALPLLMKKYNIKTKKELGLKCKLDMKFIYRYTDHYLGVSLIETMQKVKA